MKERLQGGHRHDDPH